MNQPRKKPMKNKTAQKTKAQVVKVPNQDFVFVVYPIFPRQRKNKK